MNRQENFHPDGTPLSSLEVIERIREETDTILLAFSRGKDSLAAWLVVRDYFPHVIPYHMYTVPGMRLVEESLQYYEEYFGCHIIRVPHPSTYRMLGNLVFQPPEHCAVIEAANIWQFTPEDLRDALVEQLGLNPDTTFTAVGVRAADSPNGGWPLTVGDRSTGIRTPSGRCGICIRMS